MSHWSDSFPGTGFLASSLEDDMLPFFRDFLNILLSAPLVYGEIRCCSETTLTGEIPVSHKYPPGDLNPGPL
jgi:hypothetical protein